MDLYILIKISGILIVTVCSVIATYTDVKYGIIPNKLTIPTLITGLLLVSSYYFLIGCFNFFYYISIGIVFLFNYILWRLGFWAGGDVKLFCAISSLLIPEFLDVFPCFHTASAYCIPTLYLMINSVFCIFPLIVIYCLYVIIKRKSYLLGKLFDIDFYRNILYFNVLTAGYFIFSFADMPIIQLISTSLFSFITIRYIIYNRYFTGLLTLSVVLYELYTNNIFMYVCGFVFFNILIMFGNILRYNLISEVLCDDVDVNDIREGMILGAALYNKNNSYYFGKCGLIHTLKEQISCCDAGTVIVSGKIAGLSKSDIDIIVDLYRKNKINTIPVKKGLPFAPFILAGLFLTYFTGNLLKIIVFLLEMI